MSTNYQIILVCCDVFEAINSVFQRLVLIGCVLWMNEDIKKLLFNSMNSLQNLCTKQKICYQWEWYYLYAWSMHNNICSNLCAISYTCYIMFRPVISAYLYLYTLNLFTSTGL